MKRKEDNTIINNKFGRLTPILEIGKKGNQRFFKCKCDCGGEISCRLGCLTSGNIKGCGCGLYDIYYKNIIGEEWGDLNNGYSISNKGRVKINKYNGLLKPYKRNNKSNYLSINILGKTYHIHRLMGQVFLGLNVNDKKLCVCHKDDNPENNNIDNLFIGTQKDNVRDCIKKGRYVQNTNAKIKKENIPNIKNEFMKYNTSIKKYYDNVGYKYGIKYCALCNLLKNRTYNLT